MGGFDRCGTAGREAVPPRCVYHRDEIKNGMIAPAVRLPHFVHPDRAVVLHFAHRIRTLPFGFTFETIELMRRKREILEKLPARLSSTGHKRRSCAGGWLPAGCRSRPGLLSAITDSPRPQPNFLRNPEAAVDTTAPRIANQNSLHCAAAASSGDRPESRPAAAPVAPVRIGSGSGGDPGGADRWAHLAGQL